MKSPILFTDNLEQIDNISRRQFLKQFALSGLVLAVGLPSLSLAEQTKYGADAMPHGWVDNPLVFVAIGDEGNVSRHRRFTQYAAFLYANAASRCGSQTNVSQRSSHQMASQY